MILRHFFVHRFHDGAVARVTAAYNTETRVLLQAPDVTPELATHIPEDIDEEEQLLWEQVVGDHFISEADEICRRESEARVAAHYPDAKVNGSRLAMKIAALTTEMRTWNDPLLEDPDGPYRIAELAAVQLGIEPAGGTV
jgi:hypothetical protein